MSDLRLALNPDTTPLHISDILLFKPLRERAKEAAEAAYPAVNVDRSEGLSAQEARRIVSSYGLEVASGFFHAEFYRSDQRETILQEARKQAEYSRALGQDCLFVSAWVSPPERAALAGRVTQQTDVTLSDDEFTCMAEMLNEIGRMWRDFGIQLCYHPHVATYIEAPHEVQRLMELTDPQQVRLGPDTGHYLLGGGNPVRFIAENLGRVGALHLKDVRREVLEEGRREGLNYRRMCGRGVWTELGNGCVNFPALFKVLREARWSGWVIVETDHTNLPTALESSLVSRRYLREVIGL